MYLIENSAVISAYQKKLNQAIVTRKQFCIRIVHVTQTFAYIKLTAITKDLMNRLPDHFFSSDYG